MKLSRAFAVSLLGLAVASLATAASIPYTFSGFTFGFSPQSEQFTYDAPAFITSPITVPSADLMGCVNCGSGVTFFPNVPVSFFPDVPHGDVILFPLQSNGFQPVFVFPLGAFSTLGLSQASPTIEMPEAGTGTLFVGPSPEPSTFITVALVLVFALAILAAAF